MHFGMSNGMIGGNKTGNPGSRPPPLNLVGDLRRLPPGPVPRHPRNRAPPPLRGSAPRHLACSTGARLPHEIAAPPRIRSSPEPLMVPCRSTGAAAVDLALVGDVAGPDLADVGSDPPDQLTKRRPRPGYPHRGTAPSCVDFRGGENSTKS